MPNPGPSNNPSYFHAPVQQPYQRLFDFPNVLDDGDAVMPNAGGYNGSFYDGTTAWETDGGRDFTDGMPGMPVVDAQSFVDGQMLYTSPQEYVMGTAAGSVPDVDRTVWRPPG